MDFEILKHSLIIAAGATLLTYFFDWFFYGKQEKQFRKKFLLFMFLSLFLYIVNTIGW